MQLNDIEPIIYRVISRYYWAIDSTLKNREKNGTIGFSRNRRLYSLSLSLSLLRLSMPISGFPISNTYPRTITIVRWLNGTIGRANRSRGVESISKKYPRKRISLPPPPNRVETGTTGLAYLRRYPWYRDYIWPKRRERSLTQDGDGS